MQSPGSRLALAVGTMGLIAAVAIPKFTGAATVTRDTAAKTTLQFVRGQIELFQVQHRGIPPEAEELWVLLGSKTDAGETATGHPKGKAFGPYFNGVPENPWSNLTGVSGAAMDKEAGWYYTAAEGEFSFLIRNGDGSVNYSY